MTSGRHLLYKKLQRFHPLQYSHDRLNLLECNSSRFHFPLLTICGGWIEASVTVLTVSGSGMNGLRNTHHLFTSITKPFPDMRLILDSNWKFVFWWLYFIVDRVSSCRWKVTCTDIWVRNISTRKNSWGWDIQSILFQGIFNEHLLQTPQSELQSLTTTSTYKSSCSDPIIVNDTILLVPL